MEVWRFDIFSFLYSPVPLAGDWDDLLFYVGRFTLGFVVYAGSTSCRRCTLGLGVDIVVRLPTLESGFAAARRCAGSAAS